MSSGPTRPEVPKAVIEEMLIGNISRFVRCSNQLGNSGSFG
jgi:hypothetical protein